MRQPFIIFIMLLLFTPCIWANTLFTDQANVHIFIKRMVKKHHFKEKELVALFNTVKIRPQILRQIKAPLEARPWYTYQMLFINEWRIRHGMEFWEKHAEALKKAEATYGVPASIIVATLGVETKYGQKIGGYRVIDSLSNIAFSHSSRAPYFRRELEHFLLLTRENHLDPLQVYGSYAGAIGQPQFMPSSYRRFAVNFSKTGKIDLIHNTTDVIGSIANYYKIHGWKAHQPVAIPTHTLGNPYLHLSSKGKDGSSLPIAELIKYNIVPKTQVAGKKEFVQLIELQNRYNKEYWLGFHNFNVIKKYNASDLYALAVFQLSNYLTALRNKLNHVTKD